MQGDKVNLLSPFLNTEISPPPPPPPHHNLMLFPRHCPAFFCIIRKIYHGNPESILYKRIQYSAPVQVENLLLLALSNFIFDGVL
jgi:hypothetical protein